MSGYDKLFKYCAANKSYYSSCFPSTLLHIVRIVNGCLMDKQYLNYGSDDYYELIILLIVIASKYLSYSKFKRRQTVLAIDKERKPT